MKKRERERERERQKRTIRHSYSTAIMKHMGEIEYHCFVGGGSNWWEGRPNKQK